MTKPKREIDLKSMARSYTESAVRRIEGLAQKAQSEGVRLEANRILLDRGWGTPAKTVEHKGTAPNGAIEIIHRHVTEGLKAPKK